MADLSRVWNETHRLSIDEADQLQSFTKAFGYLWVECLTLNFVEIYSRISPGFVCLFVSPYRSFSGTSSNDF